MRVHTTGMQCDSSQATRRPTEIKENEAKEEKREEKTKWYSERYKKRWRVNENVLRVDW